VQEQHRVIGIRMVATERLASTKSASNPTFDKGLVCSCVFDDILTDGDDKHDLIVLADASSSLGRTWKPPRITLRVRHRDGELNRRVMVPVQEYVNETRY